MLMAVLGKQVIHPGGKLSTEELFQRADFASGQRVLDVGCGAGTKPGRGATLAGYTAQADA
jgi:cyclopropane fatty-acyl-phospholipid synthase-like methyltransferase